MDLRSKSQSCDELRFALEQELKSSNNNVEATIVHKISNISSNRKRKISDILNQNSDEIIPFTPTEALALLVEAKLSKSQYNLIRFGAMARNANIYPSYLQVQQAKNECYAKNDAIKVTVSGASIELQQILDKTAERIVISEGIVDQTKLQLISKYGMDGSSGQSQYKQIFTNEDGNLLNDASIFMLSFVPLQLKSETEIIWENPMPSSTTLCRPLRFEFAKETVEYTKKQYNDIENEIKNLVPTNIVINDNNFQIFHSLEW